MIVAAVIFRLVLASLVAFWLPAQCCAIAPAGDGQAGEVRAVAADSAAACEVPCCGAEESQDTADAASHDKSCACDHPTPVKLAVVDGGRISFTPSAVGELINSLPPLQALLTVEGADVAPPSLHHPISANHPVPTVTLRTLCVLLTV